MSKGNTASFIIGTLFGAALGAVAGILMAPRSGQEMRDAVAGVATDAWGNAVDAYQQGAQLVNEGIDDLRTNGDVAADELREKVDQARARMDQIKSSLSEGVSQAADRARTAVNKAVDQAGQTAQDVAEKAQDKTEEIGDALEDATQK